MFEKLTESKSKSSNRRRFFRRLVGLVAMVGIGGASVVNSTRKVYAADGDFLKIGFANSGTSITSLTTSTSGTAFQVMNTSAIDLSEAIRGFVDASTGVTYGVFGESRSQEGTGVYGYANHSTGWNNGVFGWSTSWAGRGVYGYATNASGVTYGVHGLSSSISGRGVYGSATNASGTTRGVYGESLSIDGRGVEGYSSNASGMNAGVYGHSFRGAGVVGGADNYNAIPIIAWGASGQTNCLQEWTNSTYTPLAVIDKAGFLGVGTGSPSTPIHVKSSSSNPAVRLENQNDYVGQFIYCYSNTHLPFFSGRRARGTTTSPAAVQTDDVLMRYGGSGYGTSSFPGGNRAILEFKAAQTWTDAAQGTYITFSTTPTGGTGTTERLRITAAGEIIPPTDNTGSIGTASKRWSLVRATTITQGDLVYENGVRSTEEGDGIAFYNPTGTKIAVLDSEGNFRVRGRVIEGF